MSKIFIVLIILHFLGDYYLQSECMAKSKETKFSFLILHALVYAVPSVLAILLFDFNNKFLVLLTFGLAHFIIDTIKYFIKTKHYYPKICKDSEQKNYDEHLLKIDIVYVVDQLLHIVSIAIIAIVFLQLNSDFAVKQGILDYINIDEDKFVQIMKGFAAFVVILKPVSLTFYRLFNVDFMAKTDNNDDKNVKKAKGAGEIIGYMERIIIMILLIMGEYTAMGFVIAGKSIIRLNSKIKQEFFIIGTFYGIISSLIVYVIFFGDKLIMP